MRNTILLLVGESGCGKSTFAYGLEKKYNLAQVLSYTTRPVRVDDLGNQTHWHISDEMFDRLKNLVGYTVFNGYKYGATESQIELCDIYVIDPNGIEYFKKHYKGNKDIKVVYISTDDSTRMTRMLERGDSLDKAQERVQHDRDMFKDFDDYDLLIDNNANDMNKVLENIDKIYEYCFK